MTNAPYKIDAEELKQEVFKVAAERTEFVYADQPGVDTQQCSYVATTIGGTEGEGCIVGQALERLGVPKDALREWESARVEDGLNTGVYALLMDIELVEVSGDDDREVSSELGRIQGRQDRGQPWGLAVLDNLSE